MADSSVPREAADASAAIPSAQASAAGCWVLLYAGGPCVGALLWAALPCAPSASQSQAAPQDAYFPGLQTAAAAPTCTPLLPVLFASSSSIACGGRPGLDCRCPGPSRCCWGLLLPLLRRCWVGGLLGKAAAGGGDATAVAGGATAVTGGIAAAAAAAAAGSWAGGLYTTATTVPFTLQRLEDSTATSTTQPSRSPLPSGASGGMSTCASGRKVAPRGVTATDQQCCLSAGPS